MNDQARFPTIDVATLTQHIEKQDAFVVDLRSTSHGDMIYGSIRYEPKKLEEAAKLTLPLPQQSGTIVIVDEDGTSERVTKLAAKLDENGYGKIVLLDGGFKAWKDADGRMQERSLEQPVPEVGDHQLSR